MSNPLSNIGNLHPSSMPLPAVGPGENGSDAAELSFENLLLETLAETSMMQQSAQMAVEKSIAGGDITQVEVFSAVKKADLALRMLLQIRNKLLEAYKEIKQLRM